ncbi:sigma-70 family RNA polymerase sigma factor [Streptomyces griseoviridis]|uniref:Helix-turn-helix domain-containing protein n=1 Tax=Streptomyces griseoviridis TaxID=45398 RepID=A0ABT9LF95_STRGD|nr:sigma-70 family RNA polymerase sigma factor [Streptomyces griseoviridis]MDP9682375.1 hypothetical protein [Streptomyces griseoviridis]
MRQHEVVRLRTQERMQFRQIAEHLGCDVKNVYEAWKRGVGDLAEQAAKAHGEYLGEQLANLSIAIDSLMPKVIKGDVRAVEGLVRLFDHQAKLLGLYAPVKASVTVTDEMTARVKQLADEIAALDGA